jgi:tRNA (mo5U34)-methyltransferase
MIEPGRVRDILAGVGLDAWAAMIELQLQQRLQDKPHGDMLDWLDAIDSLPELTASRLLLDQGLIQVGNKNDSTPEQRKRLEAALMRLHPWRKGPYQLHGVFIDTEWRSDWKWDRLAPHLAPLAGRKVLDVGCGNGYHCWRMAGCGAELVIGIDPTQLFLMQFEAVSRLIAGTDAGRALLDRVLHLPLGIEEVPKGLQGFDTVFSMGVLYHRRSPIDHLQELRDALRPGGELVLETLVIEGGENALLIPEGRYAKMRNVWFIPSVAMLERWLRRSGFKQVRTVDVTTTSLEEQRSTSWMQFESLADFLDPADRGLTAEGYPAPCRAVVMANA